MKRILLLFLILSLGLAGCALLPTITDLPIVDSGFELNLPFWTEGQMVGIWEEILFDPFPREIGCDNGTAIYRTGVWPDDADVYMVEWMLRERWDTDKLSENFEMRIYVTTTDGYRGYAYGKSGNVITGEWVPLQTYRVLADWQEEKPPYPLQVLQKSCPVDPDDPWIPPEIPGDAGYFLVRQETRSSWGTYEAIQFNIYVGGVCP